MRKHKLISVFALALVLTLSLSACSSLYSVFFVTNMQPEANSDYMIDVIGDESEATGQVDISIIYPEEAEKENDGGTVSLYENQQTALDALNNFCWINGIDISVETGTSSYVTSISGVSENDYGDPSGWVYTVNGEEIMESADKYELSDGDSIEWKFVSFGDSSF